MNPKATLRSATVHESLLRKYELNSLFSTLRHKGLVRI
jgi:hypothetical protein